MDGLAAPAALFAALAAVPVLLVYMLRSRRPRKVVPSTFLWREATKNVTASRPWDRIKPSIILLLQLLALAALVIALARPYRTAPGVAGDHLIVVLDASGSMLATDVAPNRLWAAKAEAKRLVATLPDDGSVSVVAASDNPRVVLPLSNDPEAAERAIDSIEATDAPADLADAFLMAESLEVPQQPATIAFVSDGSLDETARASIAPGTVFRRVGTSGEDVAIRRIDVGETPSGSRAVVELGNSTDAEARVRLTLSLDGAVVVRETVTIAARSDEVREFQLGGASGRLEATIDARDILAANDQAFAVLERAAPRKILLFTPGNVFLESLVGSIPGTEVEVAAEPRDASGADLVIYDRVKVPRSVDAPALFVAPASAPKGVGVAGSIDSPVITQIAADDPLLEDVDLSDLAIARSITARIPRAHTVVGTGDGSPLLATWTESTFRRAWIGFDLHESNLPLQIAFPVLMDRLMAWLTGSEPPAARVAGDVIEVAPVPGATGVQVSLPGGRGATLEPGQVLTDTGRAGFYGFTFIADGEAVAERTVALSFPESESKLTPRDVRVAPDSSRPGLTSTSRRTVVDLVLAVALAVLILEWWWAHGRPRPALGRAADKRAAA